MKNERAAFSGILEKYHIEPKQPIAGSRFTLPVIGSRNVGKSTLINALCQQRLLPAFITSRLDVPFYLTHGSLQVAIARGGYRQPVGLHDLFDHRFDTQGVESVHIEADNAFLRGLTGLTLMDTPPIERSAPIDSSALATILVFAADEPVIKECFVQFFLENRLHLLPFYVVVTKCDKVTPENKEKSLAFFAQNIPAYLGVAPVGICGISAKEQDCDLSAVRQFALSVQRESERIQMQRTAECDLYNCTSAIDRLSYLLLLETFTLSEIEGRYEIERLTNERILTALKEYDNRLDQVAQPCQERMLSRVNDVLTEHAPVLLQVDTQYIDTVIRGAITGAYNSELKPVLQSYIAYAEDLIRVHKLACQLTAAKEQIELDLSDCPCFYGFMPPRSKHQPDNLPYIESSVLPGIRYQLKIYFNKLIQKHTASLIATISGVIGAERDHCRRMLDEIYSKKKQGESDRQKAAAELTADLNTLNQIKGELHAIDENRSNCAADEQPHTAYAGNGSQPFDIS